MELLQQGPVQRIGEGALHRDDVFVGDVRGLAGCDALRGGQHTGKQAGRLDAGKGRKLLGPGAGAEDFDASEDAAEITTDPENYSAVVKALEEKGYEILSDDLAMVPMTTTRLTDPDQLKAMGKLLDALEENDDVQNVWHSLENEEDLPE